MKRWLHRRGRDDRGLAIVEYALLVALVAVPCVKASSEAVKGSQDVFERSASDAHTGVPDPYGNDSGSTSTTLATPTSLVGGGGGGGGGGGSSSSTSSTSSSTSSTSSTTSTPPTTAAGTSSAALSASSRWTRYGWRAYYTVTITGPAGPVSGATVTMDIGRYGSGSCTTDSSGTCTVSNNFSNDRDAVTATITDVSATPAWNQTGASVTAYKP